MKARLAKYRATGLAWQAILQTNERVGTVHKFAVRIPQPSLALGEKAAELKSQLATQMVCRHTETVLQAKV